VFSGFDAPTTSPIQVALAPGSIQDGDSHAFAGDTWVYSFDPPDVVINELHYNPDGGDDLEEFIELYNAGHDAVDLAGWTIDDGDGVDDQSRLHRCDRFADVNGRRTEHPADKGVEQDHGKLLYSHGFSLGFDAATIASLLSDAKDKERSCKGRRVP
jgi:hypothetical protein